MRPSLYTEGRAGATSGVSTALWPGCQVPSFPTPLTLSHKHGGTGCVSLQVSPVPPWWAGGTQA